MRNNMQNHDSVVEIEIFFAFYTYRINLLCNLDDQVAKHFIILHV